jgi:hypothetical protein
MVIREEPKEQAIGRLRTYVQRHERRYECQSEKMIKAVSKGRVKETAEIGKWLTKYRVLKALEGCE